MNVSFTRKQGKYIASQLKTGDYQNASEVVRDALRLHEVYRHRVIRRPSSRDCKRVGGASQPQECARYRSG